MKKLIFIIYTAVIVATGLCTLIFKEHLNIVIESLIPLGVTVYNIVFGLLMKNGAVYLSGGRFRSALNSDFKYSKNSRGEGEFEVVDYHRRGAGKKARDVLGYVLILSGELSIPFIFFFSRTAKWGSSIFLILIPLMIGSVAAIIADVNETKAILEEQRAQEKQWEKELEEQKKREELGRWK